MMSSQIKSNCKCALKIINKRNIWSDLSIHTLSLKLHVCAVWASGYGGRIATWFEGSKENDVPWLVDKTTDNLIYLMLNQCYSCWMRLKNQEGVVFYVVHLFKKITLRLRRFVTTFFFSLCFLGSCPGSEVFLLLESRFSSPNN